MLQAFARIWDWMCLCHPFDLKHCTLPCRLNEANALARAESDWLANPHAKSPSHWLIPEEINLCQCIDSPA